MRGFIAGPRAVPRMDSGYSWAVALATLAMASLSFGAVTTVPILFVPMAQEFAWGSAVLSSIHTSAMIGAGIGSIFIGRILDRHGFLLIAVAGGLATGTGLFLASRAHSLWEMYLAYGLLVGGIGQGAFFSPLAAAVSLWFERHRSLAVAIALSGQSVGGLLVPPLLRIGAEAAGWRQALQGYALLCAAGLLGCALLFAAKAPALAAAVPATRTGPGGAAPAARTGPRVAAPATRRPAPSRGTATIAWLGATMACSNLATFGVAGHIVAYGEHVGMSAGGAGSMMAALFGITLVSRLSVGHLLGRGGIHAMLLAMSLLHAAGAWILLAAASPLQVALALIIIGLGFGGYLPAYGSLVRSAFPPVEAGRRLSELYLLGFLGAGGGSWVAGLLRDTGGFAPAFAAVALFSTLACVVLVLRRRRLVA